MFAVLLWPPWFKSFLWNAVLKEKLKSIQASIEASCAFNNEIWAGGDGFLTETLEIGWQWCHCLSLKRCKTWQRSQTCNSFLRHPSPPASSHSVMWSRRGIHPTSTSQNLNISSKHHRFLLCFNSSQLDWKGIWSFWSVKGRDIEIRPCALVSELFCNFLAFSLKAASICCSIERNWGSLTPNTSKDPYESIKVLLRINKPPPAPHTDERKSCQSLDRC